MSTRNAKAQEHLQHYVNRRELKHLGSQVTYALKHFKVFMLNTLYCNISKLMNHDISNVG